MSAPQISIAFYNVENLFDTVDGAHTLDHDYTPKGKKKWGPYRFNIKIQKLGNAISKIGNDMPPVLVGLAEVENKTVLNALINSEKLKEHAYQYIHFDSPDERGIDVALLFNTRYFQPITSEVIPIEVYNSKNIRDYTRDILYVKGELMGELIHIYVNHWPSKRTGHDETQRKRIHIAKLIHDHMDALKEHSPKIVVLGDFNDNPTDESIQNHLAINGLKNPMVDLYTNGLGSLKFYGKWMLFDQILLSSPFFEPKPNKLVFKEANIFNADFLTNPRGRYKNTPFRTYSGKYYLGGCSDHFPVYVLLESKKA